MTGKQPELWDAVSGQRRDAAAFTQKGRPHGRPVGAAPLRFDVRRFPPAGHHERHGLQLVALATVAELTGPWDVTFGKQHLTFEKLVDWTTRPEVRYFSGTATYRNSFSVPSAAVAGLFISTSAASRCWPRCA